MRSGIASDQLRVVQMLKLKRAGLFQFDAFDARGLHGLLEFGEGMLVRIQADEEIGKFPKIL